MLQKGQNVFTSFLELLKVKHTHEFSEKYFNDHPHKYNLFGIIQNLISKLNNPCRVAGKEQSLDQ
jgi:hypothetical protein